MYKTCQQVQCLLWVYPHFASIVHKALVHYALFQMMTKISITLVQLNSISETKTSMLPGVKKGGRLNVRDFINISLKVILFMLCMSLHAVSLLM